VLDAVDHVLVRELQHDGRATFQALADRVGLSRTAVRTRIQHLLDSGVVRVVGVLHPSILGTNAVAHLAVEVEGPARHVAVAVAQRSTTWLSAVAAGSHPVVAELRVRDDALLSTEVDAVRSLPGVRAVEVFRAVAVVKDPHSVVGAAPSLSLDEIDWRLLYELRADGRASYTEMAKTVGLSQAATRARAVRLIRGGVVHVVGLIDPAALGAAEFAGLGIRVTSDVGATARRIAALSGVTSVVTGFGRHDVLCTVDAATRTDLAEVLDAVRAVPGVRVKETWHHLDVIKRSYAATLPEQPPRGKGSA
jgi:DNA-binding Lrp family transcriptional regulator